MKHTFVKSIVSLFLFCLTIQVGFSQKETCLWYAAPAGEWMEAIPMGNGRIGVMVHGGLETEVIALNEVTFWSGQPDPDQEKSCGKEKLNEIRQLFFQGKLEEGNQQATHYLSGHPHSFGTHLPLGDLRLHFGHSFADVSGYKRELDLEKAITKVSYSIGKVNYQREYFCSNPAGLFVVALEADKPGMITFDLSFDLLQEADIVVSGNEITFTGKVSFPQLGEGGVYFAGQLSVRLDGGRIEKKENSLHVENADRVTLFTDIRTDYQQPEYISVCAATVQSALQKTYEELKTEHIKDYSSLYDRAQLILNNKTNQTHLPVDVRWKLNKEGKSDIGLEELFFNYGRYLLIASSRPESPLPAHLQGLWNDNLACNMGWTCDYHLDINTQQNYWAANITNLHECNMPLFDYIGALAQYGEVTAQKVYGSPGWVAHTVANIWGYTAPGSGVNWGLFPTAGAWLATHLWEHYLYSQDIVYLRSVAYPLLKKTAVFLLDYMIECPESGYLMTGPSTSPENSFLYNGAELALSMMPTCDRVLVYEIFRACIQSAGILKMDKEFCKELEQAMDKLPPLQIGKRGTIQEWYSDFDPAHPNHRHSSHLLALYPYNQISFDKTPFLAQAARQSIYNQLHSENWEDVEWSRANMICFYARLKDAQSAYESVSLLLRDFTRENLLTISPEGIAGAPYDIFIFDGNQAGVAGMAEMLLQSHEDYIEFLPALPDEWCNGSFTGLCVRGGAETSVVWEHKKVKSVSFKATAANRFSIKIPENLRSSFYSLNGQSFCPVLVEGSILNIFLKEGDILRIE